MRILLTVCLLLPPIGAWAQNTATVTTIAPIYVTAVVTQTPLRVAAVGTTFNITEDQGEWVRVEFKDPQWGRRSGWVQRTNLRITDPTRQPMDLSVDAPQIVPMPDQQPVRATQETPAPRKKGLSKARRITGGILAGAGAYYAISALAADSLDMGEYKTAWQVMGLSLSGAAIVVLLPWGTDSSSPTMLVGPKKFALGWRIDR